MDAFMALAFDEAKKGMRLGEGGPFGAVIVKEGKVVAKGHNEVLSLNDPTAHAEMQVIRKASATLKQFHLKGCTLYATGEPCPMCFAAIHWAYIDKVVYCMTKREASEIGFNDTLITKIMEGHVKDSIPFVHQPNSAGQELYSAWSENLEKISY